jgi:dienelactone hydrolase
MYRIGLILSLALQAVVWLSNSVVADGIQDNNPETVRCIPKEGIEVPAERAEALRAQLMVLQQKLEQLRTLNRPEITELLPDVMIFERGVRCAVDYIEFFDVKDIDKADELLKEGISRADQLIAGNPSWPTQSGLVVRGYISRIDHTVQPYGLVIPDTAAATSTSATRCDIWFHGRGEALSEVNFLWEHMHSAGTFTPAHTIVLHPYGRYCNAFKFAGEVDVLEALDDVKRRYWIDEDRISVRGFSMGGAACWQFATHYADRWFAANPGAGFSETPEFLKFFQKEDLHPEPWEKTLWNLYDCNKWSQNLRHCPTIAYSGEKDIQKQAADIMESALAEHGIRLRHIIGAGMGHRYDDESKAIQERSLNSLAKAGKINSPSRISLHTHTLKYNRMHALQIDGLIEHWKPAYVDVWMKDGGSQTQPVCQVVVYTDNVSEFTLDILPEQFPSLLWPPSFAQHTKITLSITVVNDDLEKPESSQVSDPPADHARFKNFVIENDRLYSDGSIHIVAHRTPDGTWAQGPSPKGLRKRHNLQGPIDDALMDSFVFVRPTGKPMNDVVGKWCDAELTRAIEHWRRHFRGDARVVNDTDVTEEMIQSANLILWGDPSSNKVTAQIADKLPIRWTAESLDVGEKHYESAHHAPVLIYPNPLNPNRYVVLNSSFTYRDYAYLNNARQVPMLPDWAVIDLRVPPGNVWPGKVAAADFFDEAWQLKK